MADATYSETHPCQYCGLLMNLRTALQHFEEFHGKEHPAAPDSTAERGETAHGTGQSQDSAPVDEGQPRS